jgi:hypothetical protein
VDNPGAGLGRFPTQGSGIFKEETMTRLGSLIFCATLGLSVAFSGCGSNNSGGSGGSGGGGAGGGGGGGSTGAISAIDAVPHDNTVAGWTVDTANTKTTGKVAAQGTDEKSTENLIDGAAADFYAAPSAPSLFLWQSYVNTTLVSGQIATVDLYILQEPTAKQTTDLYSALLSTSLYSGKTWTDPSSPAIGTVSRISDTGDHWWINFVKDSFYVEVSLGPSRSDVAPYGPDDTTKAAAYAFAQAVAAKL